MGVIIPTITIKRLESEKIEERPTVRGEKITWQLDADPAPITDVVVRISIPSADNQSIDVWVTIPKFKPYSEEFTNTIYGGAIEVVSLPMVSIVGEGLTVNVEKLQEGLPADTYGEHHIPKDFDFPLYNVGNPSRILCDDCIAPVTLPQPTPPPTDLPPPDLPSSPPVKEDVEPPPATDVRVFPRPGTIIPTNPEFGLTFDEGILAASINGFAATGSRLRWLVAPVLTEGSVSLDIRWTNQDGSTGSKRVGPYTVREPDTAPPRIIRGTVVHGALRVDPGVINERGFTYEFNETVTGSIRLVDAFGVNLNWSAEVADRVATLAPVAGQELSFETAYAVEIDVRDAAGNRSQLRIVFVTNLVKK